MMERTYLKAQQKEVAKKYFSVALVMVAVSSTSQHGFNTPLYGSPLPAATESSVFPNGTPEPNGPNGQLSSLNRKQLIEKFQKELSNGMVLEELHISSIVKLSLSSGHWERKLQSDSGPPDRESGSYTIRGGSLTLHRSGSNEVWDLAPISAFDRKVEPSYIRPPRSAHFKFLRHSHGKNAIMYGPVNMVTPQPAVVPPRS